MFIIFLNKNKVFIVCKINKTVCKNFKVENKKGKHKKYSNIVTWTFLLVEKQTLNIYIFVPMLETSTNL